MKFAFTDKALAALTLNEGVAQLVAWDEKLTGLGYVLGRTGGSFVAGYVDAQGARRREVLGRRDEMSLPDARAAARAVLGRVAEGKPTPGALRASAQSGPTVAEAIASYLEALRNGGARPSSIATVERELQDPDKGYVKLWLPRFLRTISARDCRDRHASISTLNGKHIANRVLRNFRTVWNHVAREAIVDAVNWPANPTIAVNWHAGESEGFEERRREPLPWSRLPGWRIAVDGLSPSRRDYQLLVLLTGLRRVDACTLRWQHVNLGELELESRVWNVGRSSWEPVTIPPLTMLRPSPKGGSAKAFVVPLSSVVVAVLRRRREGNQEVGRDDKGWVFPARTLKSKACSSCAELGLPPHAKGIVGHMAEPKEDSEDLPSPHRLRDTFITAGEEAGIPEGIVKVLVNHRWETGQNVTAGYRKQDQNFLRKCQEKISVFLLEKMKPPTPAVAQPLPRLTHLRSIG